MSSLSITVWTSAEYILVCLWLYLASSEDLKSIDKDTCIIVTSIKSTCVKNTCIDRIYVINI